MRLLFLLLSLWCGTAHAVQSFTFTVREAACPSCMHQVLIRHNSLATPDLLSSFAALQVAPSPDDRDMSASRKAVLPSDVPAVSVTVLTPGRFLWSLPAGWYPSETPGVLTTVPLPREASRMHDYEVHWWGLGLWLNRSEACSLSIAGATLFVAFLALTPVCPPCALVSFACGAQGTWIGLNLGAYGTYLEVTWLGFLIWAEPIGAELTGDDDCYDANPAFPSPDSLDVSGHDASAVHGIFHTPLGTQVIYAK